MGFFMPEIATIEPQQITAGDSVKWKKSLPEYKASDSWVFTYALVKSGVQKKITATLDGDDHLISLATTATASYDPGSR
jgi:hypothetical protein